MISRVLTGTALPELILNVQHSSCLHVSLIWVIGLDKSLARFLNGFNGSTFDHDGSTYSHASAPGRVEDLAEPQALPEPAESVASEDT